MSRISESAPHAHDRLRRIEGRHNSLVKQLRQAFAHAERTEDGNCAIEGMRIVEEAIRSGLRFHAVFFRESAQNLAERLLPQIGANVETLLLPDKLFDSVVPSETPQGVAALVRLKESSLQDLLERVQVGADCGCDRPAGSGESGDDSALGGSVWQRGRGAGRGDGESLEFQGDSRIGGDRFFAIHLLIAKIRGRSGCDIGEKLRAQNVRLLATSSHKGSSLDQAVLTGPVAVLIGSRRLRPAHEIYWRKSMSWLRFHTRRRLSL